MIPQSAIRPPKSKFPRYDALDVANELCDRLGPHCERLVVAGSLRRGKPEVGDIELLYIPKLAQMPDGLFDVKAFNLADSELVQLVGMGVLRPRPNVNGHTSWGEKNKLAVHVPSGIPVDLFSTTEDKWWCALVTRTGSKESNIRLCNGAHRLNREFLPYGVGVRDRASGEVLPATSEKHVFELCGVDYLEPERR